MLFNSLLVQLLPRLHPSRTAHVVKQAVAGLWIPYDHASLQWVAVAPVELCHLTFKGIAGPKKMPDATLCPATSRTTYIGYRPRQ